MDLATLGRLVSGEGWGLLQSLPPYDEDSAMALGSRLRAAGFDADLVSAALTQSRLRARAIAKFGDFAGGMIFTPDGLEQATRLEVAAQHAQRFRAAGVRHVLDLGCGIGADAMALAGLDLQVTAVDADELTAAIAGVNLRHWPGARTTVGRVEDRRLPTGEGARHAGAWLDPARRTPGVTDAQGRTRRVFSLEAISPSWSTVQGIARDLPATGAKLSPSTGRCRPGSRRSGRRTPVRCSSARCGGDRSPSAPDAPPWSCAGAPRRASGPSSPRQTPPGRRRRPAASPASGRGCTSPTGR